MAQMETPRDTEDANMSIQNAGINVNFIRPKRVSSKVGCQEKPPVAL